MKLPTKTREDRQRAFAKNKLRNRGWQRVTVVVIGLSVLAVAYAYVAQREPPPQGPNVIESPVNTNIRYETFGDSITLGRQFEFSLDPDGTPRKTTKKYQGWPELLGDLLTRRTGIETEVANIGQPGVRAVMSKTERLPKDLGEHDDTAAALLSIGTNDSNDFKPTPSGRACVEQDCSDTFKGELLQLVTDLQDAGRETVFLGILTPAWGAELDEIYPDPLNSIAATRNARIQEYNEIIIDELSQFPGVELGPDLFSCFLTDTVNRFSLFEDALHPNVLGYTFIAALWRDAITNGPVAAPMDPCPAPIYILESLDPYAYGHKQNLLSVGDRYYTDESFTLVNVPAEIENGIWVTQPNGEKDNQEASFLSFDVGPDPVTVYIAYDSAGDPPISKTHRLSPVSLSAELRVSDPSVESFAMVASPDVTGEVSIGGNRSGTTASNPTDPPVANAQQAYVVIVVP